MMEAITVFILGLAIGSFLNVAIDRLPKDETVIKGRSYCDFCRHQLAWYDLIPIISFLLLGRKCRYCHAFLSWQYPLVELTTGTLFLFTYTSLNRYIEATSFLPTLLYYLIIISGLVAIFSTDLKYRIIPDQVIIVLICASLLFQVIFQKELLWTNLVSGFIVFFLFFILILMTKGKGMGFGDAKFAFLMGIILGFPTIIVAIYLSFLTGAVFSLILIISGKKKMKSTIPFGPFLVICTWVSLFYGDSLWLLIRSILGL